MIDLIEPSKRVLVVAAHPDDEVIGCGGTIAKLTKNGVEVSLLVLGGVTTSRYKDNKKEEDWKKSKYIDELESSSRLLEIKNIFRENLDDNRFDTYPLLDIVKKIEKIKMDVSPEYVFTHWHSDLNIDHEITHRAVLTSFRPDINKHVNILAFEVLSSSEWSVNHNKFQPHIYVDISSFIEKKLDAMRCYKSEIREYPYPRSIDGIKIHAHARGLEVCLDYAEAFMFMRYYG